LQQALCRWLHPQPQWRRREQAIQLRLPLVARLIEGSALSQIFRILATTEQAGLMLVEGLNCSGAGGGQPVLSASTRTSAA